jgi:hypothetical protein
MKYLIFTLLLSPVLLGFSNLDSGKEAEELLTCDPGVEACNQLVDNCRATAQQNYDNGTYNEAEYHLFYDSLCPMAGLECIFDTFEG